MVEDDCEEVRRQASSRSPIAAAGDDIAVGIDVSALTVEDGTISPRLLSMSISLRDSLTTLSMLNASYIEEESFCTSSIPEFTTTVHTTERPTAAIARTMLSDDEYSMSVHTEATVNIAMFVCDDDSVHERSATHESTTIEERSSNYDSHRVDLSVSVGSVSSYVTSDSSLANMDWNGLSRSLDDDGKNMNRAQDPVAFLLSTRLEQQQNARTSGSEQSRRCNFDNEYVSSPVAFDESTMFRPISSLV